MPSKKPEGWTPKRDPSLKTCFVLSCCAVMPNNAHRCPACGNQTQAGINAEIRKAGK